jgi:hypothetical protein
MHGNFFLVLRVTFLFVMFSAARSQATSVHHHDHESAPHNTGSRGQSKGSLLPAGKQMGDLQQFCRCPAVTRQTGKAHTSQKCDVSAIHGNPLR